MPVQKIPYAHRFGIISVACKEKIEKDIVQRQQQRESDRSSSTNTADRSKKNLLLEVTEEFVRDYNRTTTPAERTKLNEIIYRMLQRLKRKATQCQVHQNRPIQLQMAWAELCLLSQCRSCYQEECLSTLYRALIHSPLSAAQIPTLFFLAETILYWLKNEAILEPFLTSTELKLLKIGQIVFQLLYFHYLEGSTGPYEQFKIRLYSYLEGLEECESAYSSYSNAVWCISYIASVGSILVASVGKHMKDSRRRLSATSQPVPQIPPEELQQNSKSVLSSFVQELSPIIWHSVDVWLCVKKHSITTMSSATAHYYHEAILSLVLCRHKLIKENWIDVVIAFQILADVAKTNMDMLETIQLLAQPESPAQLPLHKRAETHLLSRGWRSWSWQLIILLCECLTSICIDSDQAHIKRVTLFGTETSSENILANATSNYDRYERKSYSASSTTENGNDHVCLMHMVNYRTDERDDQSWRVRYMGLLCMSQVYKHLTSQDRHKTLSNLLWTFIHECEQRERDDRVLEGLKVGQFDDNILQTLKFDVRETPVLGTIYTTIAQRLADGLLTELSPSDMQTAQFKVNARKPQRKTHYLPPSYEIDRHRLSLPSVPQSRSAHRPVQVKKIIEENIDSVFKRKGQVLQSIVVEQYRKELEEKKDETADVVEQLDTMVEKANETTTYDETSLTNVFTLANKKFIHDPLEERRALIASMGQVLIFEENDNH